SVAAVPAEGALTHRLLEGGDGTGDVLALGGARQLVVLDPPPAVAAHVVAGLADGLGGQPGALEGAGAAEDGQGRTALVEEPGESPDPDAAAVLEHALGGEVAALHTAVHALGLGETALRVALAVLHRRLRALLVVDDEVDGETGAVRPFGVRGIRTVPDQVAVVRWRHDLSSSRGCDPVNLVGGG